MNKFIPVLMGSLFTLTAFAQQNSSTMDGANQTIINTCRSEGGTYIAFKDDKCEYSGCAYVGKNDEVNYNGDNERVTGGCSIADYRVKARNKHKAELDKKIAEARAQRDREIADLERAKADADRIGARGAGGAGAGEVSGSGAGAAGAQGGKGEAGAGSGAGSTVIVGGGAAGGGFSGNSDFVFASSCVGYQPGTCTTVCHKECKEVRNWKTLFITKVSGLQRNSCRECMLANNRVFGDLDVIISYNNANGSSRTRATQNSSGVTLKPGAGSASAGGAVIISGGGSVAAGSGAGTGVGAGSTIIVAGGAGAGAGVQRPAFCDSPKKKDLEACAEWIRNNQRFMCSSGGNASACMGGADADISARYSVTDCVNCGVGSRKQSTWSGVAEVLGAVSGPLAMLGSSYFNARAYQKGQEAWAGAAATGFEQCQLSQNNYMQYLSANELPGLTPAQQAAMNCNGYSLNGFAGLGNAGLNGYYGAGYTPGYIGGMMGPYGMYNPYGVGGYVGGAVGGIGIAGGINAGMAGGYYNGGIAGGYYNGGLYGGYNGGMAGGFVNGISIAGGINGGMTGYYNGGMAGGYYNGGMAGGYYNGGIAGGYYNGGLYGGYNGGIAGGLATGISIAGGINGGYYNGGMAGGYYNGGMPGGYMAGGIAGGGYIAAGQVGGGYYNGGMAGGYMAGGIAGGGYMAGGIAGGGYNPQATNYDRMLQQQGTMYQMSSLTSGGTGYGAGMYPLNMGMGF